MKVRSVVRCKSTVASLESEVRHAAKWCVGNEVS